MMKEGEHLVVSAPGKVILHGEHAVVHGKRALACSLNLRTYLHVTPSTDGMVRMNLPDINIYREWKVEDLTRLFANKTQSEEVSLPPVYPPVDRFNSLCEFCGVDSTTHNTKDLATVAFIHLYTSILSPSQIIGLDFMVSSNLPTSAGLGSSAAFAVALVSSLLKLSNQISDPGTQSFNPWTGNHLEVINSWAFIAEKIIHGNPSGVDNSVSTYGGIVKYQNKALERLSCKHELSVIITNTKVPRSTKHMVSNVADKLKQYPTVINPVLDAVEAISQRCQDELTSTESLDDSVIRDMMSANHALLCVLGVNHPAIEKVCRMTHDHGLTSKLTGAGGGGCVITFLPAETPEEKTQDIISQLTNQGYECWKTLVGGPGVGLHFGEPNTDFIIPTALQSRAKLCHIL